MSTMTEGLGTINAVVVVFDQPAALVRGLLPQSLHLDETSQKHALYLIFARNIFGTWFGTLDYDEMILGIPNVRLSEEQLSSSYNYMPKLYLNARLPRILGNRIFGYEKDDGLIRNNFPAFGTQTSQKPQEFSLHHPASKKEMLKAEFSQGESCAPLTGRPYTKAQNALSNILDHAAVSQATRRCSASYAQKKGGTLLFSKIQYAWSPAKIRALRGHIEFTPEFLPAALGGIRVDVQSPLTSDIWAVHIETTQSVGLPTKDPPLA